MHSFGVVQAHRTFSNLLEPQHHRDSKVWRGLSHEFGVVRLYRTFSIYIVEGETRCAWCLCPSSGSGWFKHSEPPRTYSNHIITEIARCGEVCHRVVRLYRTFPRYIATGETRSAGCLCPSSGWFKHIEPLHYRASKVWRVLSKEFGVVRLYRTFSIYIVTGVRVGSMRFDVLEPPRTSA